MPLGDLIYDVGGGTSSGKEFKAAQIGGPSGGCIPKQHLNVPLDYESLSELGAIMGSGGLIVMDEDSCMVDVARFFLEFVQEESCGKCVPCRVGTKRMLEILNRICEGHGEEADVERLIDLGEMIKDTSLCGLGQTAPNPVLSTIRHFGHEYIEHIRDKHCRAGVCPSLVYAPCSSACPANVDIPGYVSLIAEKRYAEALRLHREKNPLAAICSRVCFHTCEDKCRRSTLDAPVSIRGIKRFMVDQEVTIQLPEVRENPANAKRKIAIVGAGPAGLSCAYFLARLGYRPMVFEAEPRPGGMLVQAIPAYRLPREIVAREIRMIERMGVDIQTNMSLGRDFTLKSLRGKGYEAVFLGVGAPIGVGLGIPGEHAEGITDALSFLRTYNLRGSVPVGKNVVVIGGGNSAIDAARTAVRLGAESVTVVYRRSRDVMPAYKEEIEEAEHEGVTLKLLTAPVEVIAAGRRVAGIKCLPMRLGEFDRSGRRRPEEGGDTFVIPADHILVAIGQTLDLKGISNGFTLETRQRDFVQVNPVTGQTSEKWIFAGGDAVSGPSSVVEAVAAGERAAVGIDQYLTGQIHAFWRETREVDTFFDPDAEPVDTPREKLDLIPVERRRENFDEVELPWRESVAVCQAKRCLRCDYGRRGTEEHVTLKCSAGTRYSWSSTLWFGHHDSWPTERLFCGAATRTRLRGESGDDHAMPGSRTALQRNKESDYDQPDHQQYPRRSSRRRHALGRGQASGHQDPHALPRGRAADDRRLPRLRGRGRRGAEPLRFVRHAGRGGDEGPHEHQPRPQRPADRGRTAALGAQRRLPDLRPQRRLRAAGPGRRAGHPRNRLRRRADPQAGRYLDARLAPRHGQVHQVPPLRERLRRSPARGRPLPAEPRFRDGHRPGLQPRPVDA